MARPRRRKQKVALRRSHAVYQWKLLSKVCLVGVLWAALILGGAFAAREGFDFWRDSAWFRIKDVRVDPKAPSGLAQALGLKAGGHLFGFSTRVLEARLANAYPELSEVRVRRRLDGGVKVSVARRVPRARVQDGPGWMGIDSAGVLFPLRSPDVKPETLPIFAGAAGARAVPVLDFMARLRAVELDWTRRLLKVKADADGDLFLFLDNGTPIYWGPVPASGEVLEKKASRLERVLKDDSLAGGAAYVRFVDDARIAVKPRPAAADEGGGRK